MAENEYENAGLIPDAPTRELGEDFSSQAARGAGHIEHQHREAEQSGRALIALPNGEMGYLDENQEFVGDQMYLSGKHGTLFDDAVNLIEDPTPGSIFVWAAKYNPKGEKANPQTVANLRAGRYKPVTVQQLKPDIAVPIEEHKIAGIAIAGITDVVLCEVPIEAQKMLYRWRVFEAKRRTNRWEAFQGLRDRVQGMSNGQADAEIIPK